MKVFITTEIVYLLAILFEYWSVAGNLKRQESLAKQEGRIPLSNEVRTGQRITYSISAVVGAVVVALACWVMPLVGLGFGYALFTTVLVVGLVLRNVIYTHAYSFYIKRTAKRKAQEEIGNYRNMMRGMGVDPDALDAHGNPRNAVDEAPENVREFVKSQSRGA